MRLVCLVLLICLMLVWGALVIRHEKHKLVSVVYTGTAFNPPALRIPQGGRVLFKNASTRAVWPASNDHPSHTAYPEFDPKKGIAPGDSWTMQFNRVGVWRFHNHLLPSQDGVVSVFDPHNPSAVISTDCAAALSAECLRAEVDTVIATKGVAAALDVVAKISNSNTSSGLDCHGLMHTVGQAAFAHSLAGEYPSITDATAYCGYGFFHGYVEAAFLSGSSPGEATDIVRGFCSYVREHADVILSDACFHGVGHGSLAFVLSDEGLWGKPLKATTKALDACKTIAPNETSYSRCASGVFMEFGEMVVKGQYTMSVDPARPFALCEALEQQNRLDCYTQWYGIIKYLAKGDFSASLSYIDQIPDAAIARESVITLVGADPDLSESHLLSRMRTCNTVTEWRRWPCFEGLVLAALLNAPAGTEYKIATKVCTRSEFPDQFVAPCYAFLVDRDTYAYRGTHMSEICSYMTRDKKPPVCVVL